MTTVMDGLVSDELWALVRAVVAGRRDYPAGVAVREPRTSTHRWAMPLALAPFVNPIAPVRQP
jgi:hypothetical protein